MRETLPTLKSAGERLAFAFHAKLDILKNDRPLMGTLLRYAGDSRHPLSFLGEAARPIALAPYRISAAQS